MGINLRQLPSADGKRDFLRVTNVVAGSPASKTIPASDSKVKINHEGKSIEIDYAPSAGLKVGDIIYYVDEQKEYTTRADLFSSYLASRSLVPGRETVNLKVGRKIMLEQKDSPGKAQETFIFVDYAVNLRPACKVAN